MNLNALVKAYYENREKRERKIGRFYSSEIYSILTNKLKPEDFFKEKKFDLIACKNMFEGEIREKAFKILLDASKIKYEYQPKKVKKFKDFEIVCVADFLFPNYILECKCPREFSGRIKDYHRPQLECQYRIFKKEVYVGYIKPYMDAIFYKYIPSDLFWKEIVRKLLIYYQQVKRNLLKNEK